MIIVGADSDVIDEVRKSGREISYIVDPNLDDEYEGVKIVESDEEILDNKKRYENEKLIIGVDGCKRRNILYNKYNSKGFEFGVVDNSKKNRAEEVGEGTIIMSGCYLSRFSSIGKNVKISYSSVVGHDSKVNDSSILAPRSTVLGYVNIGRETYIGSSSTICPRVKIVSEAKVGAGSTIADDINKKCIMLGYYPIDGMHKMLPKV